MACAPDLLGLWPVLHRASQMRAHGRHRLVFPGCQPYQQRRTAAKAKCFSAVRNQFAYRTGQRFVLRSRLTRAEAPRSTGWDTARSPRNLRWPRIGSVPMCAVSYLPLAIFPMGIRQVELSSPCSLLPGIKRQFRLTALKGSQPLSLEPETIWGEGFEANICVHPASGPDSPST
jgi:hypothetical protein